MAWRVQRGAVMKHQIMIALVVAGSACSKKSSSDEAPKPVEAAPTAHAAAARAAAAPPPHDSSVLSDLSQFDIPATIRTPVAPEISRDDQSRIVRVQWGGDFVDLSYTRPKPSELKHELAQQKTFQLLDFKSDADGELMTWKDTETPVQWHVDRYVSQVDVSCSHTTALEDEKQFAVYLAVCSSLTPTHK